MCAFHYPNIPNTFHICLHSGFQSLSPIVTLCLILLTSIFLTGCIHTYPTPEESIDPTEISVELTIEFADEWSSIQTTLSDNASDATRAENWPLRLYIEIEGHSGVSNHLTRVIESQEIVEGHYNFTLPFKLKAEEYTIAVWVDYLNPDTSEPLGYDISQPYLIKELLPRGEETEKRMCLTTTTKFDLSHLAGQWETTDKINLTLTSPMTRFRLVANDYEDFMAQTEEARKHGEKYYITLRYDSDIPGSFNLPEGLAMDPLSGCEFTTPLIALTIPGIEMAIASDWLFNPPTRHTHTMTVSVFNSAKAIVAQTTDISFPTERGKVTTITGKLLTNFITGGIQINNIWAGEIIIELE